MTVTSFLILRAIITYAVDIDIDIDIGKADIDRPLPVSERANILMSVNTTFARKSCPTSIKRRAFIVCPMLCVCPSHFLSTRLQIRPLNGFLQLIA